MKKLLLSIFCFVITFGSSAQMVNKKYVPLKDMDLFQYSFRIIENDADQFSAYIYPRRDKKHMFAKKNVKHTIAVFNKKKRTFSYHDVIFPATHYTDAIFDTGKDYFATFTRIEKKSTVYCTTHIPKGGTENARPEKRMVIPTTAVYETYLDSPDGNLHAVILLAAFKKAHFKVYVFVYNAKGEEVTFEEFTPSTRTPLFSFSKAVLMNNGNLTMLFINYEQKGKQYSDFMLPLSKATLPKPTDAKNTSLHVATLINGELTEYRIPHFSFGEIHSASLLPMDSNKCFIGGYYGEMTSKPSIGYFSCIFDPHSEDIIETQNYMLPEEQKGQDKHMFLVHLKYHIHVRDIVRLENGKVVMLGEHCAYSVQTSRMGNTTTTSYSNWASDIVYQTFDTTGECERNDMVRKLQSYSSGSCIAPETFSDYVYAFKDFRISYDHIVDGNNIYLIYNNSLEHDKYCNPTPLEYGSTCIRLTKLSPDGAVDYKTIMKCSTRKSYLKRLWLVDDDGTVYICTTGKQGYGIESFEIKN